MAKKKKGARKTASRGARKAPSRGARKAARPRVTTARVAALPGLEHPRRINLEPLKKIITAHIERLQQARAERTTDEMENTLKLLQDSKQALTSACDTTRLSMVIEF